MIDDYDNLFVSVDKMEALHKQSSSSSSSSSSGLNLLKNAAADAVGSNSAALLSVPIVVMVPLVVSSLIVWA